MNASQEIVTVDNKKIEQKKALMILGVVSIVFTICFIFFAGLSYLYNSVYFYRTTLAVESSKFIIFHKDYDKQKKEWLIGVVDEDRAMVGSFKCPIEPKNDNPQLYYITYNLTSFSGNQKTEYSFDNLLNCVKVITLPNLSQSVQLRL